MRIIGVIDVLGGRAVAARGGRRDTYEPIEHIAGLRIAPGDVMSLAKDYVERFGLSELYLADLDAITGRPPQSLRLRTLAALGASISVDAGISSVECARSVIAAGADRIIVGLETLDSFDTLSAICGEIGPQNVIFSLDLNQGTAKVLAGSEIGKQSPEEIAAAAVGAGAQTLILLDLARVGNASGFDLGLLRRIHSAVPLASLLVGGGLRHVEDMKRAADCGCDGVLIATALQRGSITATDIEAAFQY